MMTDDNCIIVPTLSTFVRKHASEFAKIRTTRYSKESIGESFNQYLEKVLGANRVSPVIYRNHYDDEIVNSFLCHGYYVEWASSRDVICFLMENDVSVKHDIYWCFP